MAKKKTQETEDSSVALSPVEVALAKFRKLNNAEVVLMNDDFINRNIPVTSFGSLKIDIASGVGGAPHGRIIELIGPESSGKSTLCIMLCAQAQKKGNMVAYIDAEHALDPKYCASLGLDLSNVLLLQPDSGEQGLGAATDLCSIFTKGDVIIIDSVAALTPQAELDGDMGSQYMGLQARLMGQACRKLTGIVSKNGILLVFINQIRQKIGVMFGSNETTAGGNALKFYASLRMDIRKTGTIKKDDIAVHNKVRVKFIKNKVAPPFREAETIIRFGEGIPYLDELVDLAVAAGVIQKGGAGWMNYGDLKLQGVDKFVEYFTENPETLEQIEIAVKAYYHL